MVRAIMKPVPMLRSSVCCHAVRVAAAGASFMLSFCFSLRLELVLHALQAAGGGAACS